MNTYTHITRVDFEEAFDSLNGQKLWDIICARHISLIVLETYVTVQVSS